jgi:hypothetical protein
MLHPGWVALVAVTGEPGRLEVLLRRRIELLPTDNSVPRFAYHQAAELPAPQAAELIEPAEAASQAAARVAINDVRDHLRSRDLAVRRRAYHAVRGRSPRIFRRCLVRIRFSGQRRLHCSGRRSLWRAKHCGLAVISVRERDVWAEAATTWGLKEAELRKQVDGLRKSVGAPWGIDQNTAAAFALLALHSSG